MEPQWNPSVELQAIGRALRLGQTEQVAIVRYIVKHTIEDVSTPQHLPGAWIAEGKSLTWYVFSEQCSL